MRQWPYLAQKCLSCATTSGAFVWILTKPSFLTGSLKLQLPFCHEAALQLVLQKAQPSLSLLYLLPLKVLTVRTKL